MGITCIPGVALYHSENSIDESAVIAQARHLVLPSGLAASLHPSVKCPLRNGSKFQNRHRHIPAALGLIIRVAAAQSGVQLIPELFQLPRIPHCLLTSCRELHHPLMRPLGMSTV